MNKILCSQLAADFCCTAEEVADSANHFTVYTPLDGRRRYHEDNDCFLKIAVVNGKILFSGKEEIVPRCREKYSGTDGAWFFETKSLFELNDLLKEYGYHIKFAHPFYISETPSTANTDGFDIGWYEKDDIGQFRGCGLDEAFGFCETAPDMLGVSASVDGKMIGMAGASCDSPTMWQIGINVDAAARGKGTGTMLVTLLKNRILQKGILPFYGTSMSHIASQMVAHGAGFVPAWAELTVAKAE